MRVFVKAAACGAMLVAVSSSVAAAQGKLAYIRSQDIVAAAPGRAAAEATFNREMATYRTQVQRMGDSLNTMIADYNKAETALSPAAKQTRQKAIQTKEQEYQQRTAQLEQEAQRRQLEIVQPIYAQIQKIIEDMRSEGGYSFIFDVSADSRSIIAADKSLDITDQVIAKVKALPGVASTPSAAPTAGAPLGTPAGVTRPKTPPTR